MFSALNHLSPKSRKGKGPTNPSTLDASLYHACSASNWAEAESLIEGRVGLDYRKADGSSVLHCAIDKKAPVYLLEKLLATGCDPNTPNKFLENTPLHYAARVNAKPEVVRLLIQYGADVNRDAHAKISPLLTAVDANGSVELIQALIDAGADINHRDSRLWTCVHWAVQSHCSTALLQLILKNGGDPNAQDIEKRTPLRLAIQLNESQVVINGLIAKGAKINEELLYLRKEKKVNPKLIASLEKMRMLTLLCTPRGILKRSRSGLRLLPSELSRLLRSMLF